MRAQKATIAKLITLLYLTLTLCLISKPCFAWSSARGNNLETNTHFWILSSAIDILKKNEGDRVTPEEVELLEDWKLYLGFGISFADYNTILNSTFSFGSHFYNPDTKKSFIPTKTAIDMGAHYFLKAGRTYKEDRPLRAFYYLGLSLHYLTDITQPLHAGNITDLNLKAPHYHTKFENFAATRHKFCKVDDGDAYWNWHGKDPYQWIHGAAVDAKKQFKNIYNKETVRWYWKSLYNSSYKRRWQEEAIPIIQERLTAAQRITAGYIHMWFETYVFEANLNQGC